MSQFNRRLVALSPIFYFGQELQRGDQFYATSVDADYFVTRKRAEDAVECDASATDGAPPPAPTPAPAPTPSVADSGDEPTMQKPSEGLTVAQIKAELTARGIDFPSGFVPKDKLAALLDGAADA